MFVLERKVQEGFWIEGPIFVKVLAVGRRRVKLGVMAPEESIIVRDKLWPRPAAERRKNKAFQSLNGKSGPGILPISAPAELRRGRQRADGTSGERPHR